MTRAGPAQRALARRLLEAEAGSAAQIYDKLHMHMAPLVGDTGFQLLIVRSAKLAKRDFADLASISILEGGVPLRQRLEERGSVSRESAEALFATFLSLTATLIGERLTTQVLQRAWPSIATDTPGEDES